MISREAAAETAELYARAHGLGTRTSAVTTLQEIRDSGRREPNLYTVADWRNCWIAYIEDPDWAWLRSSTIVIIDPDDGSVVFAGPAGDEG